MLDFHPCHKGGTVLKHSKRSAWLVASALGVTALAVAGVLALRPAPAEAQGIQSVPACQCSAPISILNLSTTITQCLCGSATCVISQDNGPGKGGNLMQCVR
jgi:hypothetical protein